jgi:hypothetical protein
MVDSREWEEPERDLAQLGALVKRVALSDIVWARLQPWREAVAALWPDVVEASALRVVGPNADALLLAHWLGARLRRRIELELEPAEEVELVEVDGLPARPRRLERRSASDLLSGQLDLYERDPIYEEALWSFSPAPT